MCFFFNDTATTEIYTLSLHDALPISLEGEENNAKWMIVNNLEYLNNLDLFSPTHTAYNELVSSANCSIINLKGIPPDVQEIIVYKLLKDLFDLRKKNKVPPFFTVIEEAHNYCPERSFGETKCSKIIRTIASEGRKFGLGLCVVTQRPARIDKSVLSQCTTQIILKVTNPSDLRALTNSVEGITAESEAEIKNLPVGTAMLTGITDMPLFITVRPRMTEHGGHAVDLIEKQEDFLEQVQSFEQQELLPIIKPKTTVSDLKLMSDEEIADVNIILVPACLLLCRDKDSEFGVLVEMEEGDIVIDVENFQTKKLPETEGMPAEEIKMLKFAYSKKVFTAEDALNHGFSSDAETILNRLAGKGLLEKNEETFTLSNDYIFSKLTQAACYCKPEFEKVSFTEKLRKKADLDELKEKISKFTDITDFQECFVVKYEVIKEG